jgi:imidazoleglycerol phosphate dehydratase HisB
VAFLDHMLDQIAIWCNCHSKRSTKRLKNRFCLMVSIDSTQIINMQSNQANIDTGVAFLDHMLDQIARHGLMDLTIKCDGCHCG